MFPNRINMQIVRVIDRANIDVRIWERGAGYTLASGSSSCAAAAASHRLGFVDNDVTVHMPGGTLHIEIADDGVGGAVEHPGGGLSGLRDRITAVEGRLRISSPPGGPTLLAVELPCGS
jgi:diaminopimelate epimerase